ncbi:FecR family protein [Pedobacter africanus]|uniref:FecR family protein n=1 Tax=Pedobacter africanus TaxID=151894 RepID=A0A1W2D986_9SPHI|nr:FecR family protein [Pedobacter africanus]SMC94029.1 FecR family protein [Pedobacter africanus]
MIDKDQYIAIAGKVADGIASDSELALYNAYYNTYQSKYPAWNKLGKAQKKHMLDETALLIQAQLKPKASLKQFKLWSRVTVVAAAVTAIMLGVFIYYISSTRPTALGPEFVSGSKDIAPGKNRATLTFADGKVVTLSAAKQGVVVGDHKLTYNDGSLLPSSKAATQSEHQMRMLTAATPRGGTYHVTLPDGTVVWLNAASTLKFPSTFSKQTERRVELTGEAYFEVFKNKDQPFIVHARNQDVRVLGTRFNIENYPDVSFCRTSLVEGSIQLSRSTPGPGTQDVILVPGQQALLTNSALNVEIADVNAAIAWTKGDFVFLKEDLPGIMKELARWYDIEVEYRDAPQHLRFDAIISRSKNLSAILQTMQITGRVKFKIDGRKVIVTK